MCLYKYTVLLFVAFVGCNSFTIETEDFYEQSVNSWTFAYRDYVSDLTYANIQNLTFTPGKIRLLSDFNLPNNSFSTPMAAFVIDIIYYMNDNVYPTTLLLNKNILSRMITEQSMRWNDPELVQLNPELSLNTVLVRMVFDTNPTPINGKIISWIFGKDVAEQFGNSFVGLAAPKHSLVNGMTNVVLSTSLTQNTASFAPLQYMKDLDSDNLRRANLMMFPESEPINGTITNETIYQITNTSSSIQFVSEYVNDKLLVYALESNTSWPFFFFGYYDYTDVAQSCNENIILTRFMFWALNTNYLQIRDQSDGYIVLPQDIIDLSKDFLMSATCNGHKMLVYDNTSNKTRGNSVYAVSVAFTCIYFGLFLHVWIFHSAKAKITFITSCLCTIFGLAISITAYTLWWYSPSNDGICIARYWVLGIGYINVNAAIFGYVYSINVIFNNLDNKQFSKKLISSWRVISAYLVVNVIEIIILILWQIIEQPKSVEQVIDGTNWETIYTCSENYGIMFTIQLIYFCCVCVWGCNVLYKYLHTKTGQEDFRPHINALHGQLYLIIPLIIILRLVELSDNQLYGIVIPFFTFLNGIIISAFALPKIFKKLKQDLSSNSKNSAKTSSILTPSNSHKNFDIGLEEIKKDESQ